MHGPLRQRVAVRLVRAHEDDRTCEPWPYELGRLDEGAERLHALAVDEQLAAQDTADALPRVGWPSPSQRSA